MPRAGGNADVRWFDVEPCCVFHPMNAYDDGDTTILDVVRHPKMFDTDHLAPNEGPPTLADGPSTWPMGRCANHASTIAARSSLAWMSAWWASVTGNGYAPAIGEGATAGNVLLKHDFVRGRTQSRSFGTEKALGEFVFHPSAPGVSQPV